MTTENSSASFFESKYARDADPWNFEQSEYEQERYHNIILALDNRRYARAFEPGCSIGILTRSLAAYCDWLYAVDVSPTAVSRAQTRCQSLGHVHIECGTLQKSIPLGKVDLIVFSEIGYYLSESELHRIVALLSSRLSTDGVLIAAHWLGQSSDHQMSGDQVHQILRECDHLRVDKEQRFDRFRLDRLVLR